MGGKISQQKLEHIVEKVRKETREDFSESLQEIYGPKRKVTQQEIMDEIVPKLLSSTFAHATRHAEYIVIDTLKELELIRNDD